VRAANTVALKEAQDKNLEKLGLLPGKSAATLAKGLSLVQAAKPVTSATDSAGLPMQLNQAAQSAALPRTGAPRL